MESKKQLHPYLKFTAFALGIQLIIWVLLVIFDLMEESGINSEAGLIIAVIMPILPTAKYFKLKKKHFSTDRSIIDSLIHILIWTALGILISTPIVISVFNGTWMIPQKSNGEFLDLNGIEYLYPPIIDGITAAVMILFSLLPAVVKKIKDKKAER